MFLSTMFLFFQTIKNNPIKIPFNKILSSEYTFYNYFINNQITTYLELGTPKQTILINIKLYEFPISILSNKNKGLFNEKKSTSFNIKEKCNDYYYKGNFEGCISNDVFNFKDYNNKNINVNNFSFLLINNSSIEAEMNNNSFGLTFYSKRFSEEQFIYQLKKNQIINSYVFYFKYNDKDNTGNLIIGNYPHEIGDNYNKNLLKLVYINIKNNEIKWKISMDEIFNGNNLIEEKSFIEFKIDIKGIIGTKIYNDYLNIFINNNSDKCKMEISKDNNFKYYYCDKKVDFSKFESLYFKQKEFNTTFELNYKDLWFEFNGNYYFLIIFHNNNLNDKNWILGEIFLKKYLFVFDKEKKVIGYYTIEKKGFPFLFILNIILVILVLVFGFGFWKYYHLKPKKIRANELIEKFDYSSYLK